MSVTYATSSQGRPCARLLAALGAVVVLAGGCGTEGVSRQVQPRDGRAGVYLTGTVGGEQVAVSDGSPDLVTANCQPRLGPSDDLCFISRTVTGTLFVLNVRNPDVLAPGTVPVADADCTAPAQCEAVVAVAIVEVRLGDGPRRRATAGELRISHLEPPLRYAGTMRLELSGGDRLSGHFDVIPRPDP